jgi:two-component system sensor histidine kinase CpxA
VLLLLVSETFSAGGLVMDWTPWLVLGGGAVAFSVLFWIPLVHRMTRTVSRMKRATERIAEGDFGARVPVQPLDELGDLGAGINRMAERLDGFVRGQKRFLGDVAHELCSPLARIQVALGILESRADEGQREYLAEVQGEVRQMSTLIDELLSFSRAGLGGPARSLGPVAVAPLVGKVVDREAAGRPVEVRIPEGLEVMAEAELLQRAVANLVRNAVRYAGEGTRVEIEANADSAHVRLTVADSGPGVPEAELPRIFDPFYRLEPSRNRATGGAGLGLAIVKTCVEACGGTLSARNRSPSGLQVDMVLDRPRQSAEGPVTGR